jgi:enoyl-CoA hydratase/carnithine racemase
MNELIHLSEKNNVLHIQLNRLDKKNALTSDMYQTLMAALTNASDRTDIHAVLIYGNEQCFCAGNDLHDFMAQHQQNDLVALHFVQQLANFDKPLIAAVAGVAIGIGTTLLLHCDMVLAAPNAHFQLPFSQLGLCPEAGSSLLLTQRIGYNKAFELLVLGQSFSAEQALQYQLVNQICSPEQLIATATQVAEQIAQLSPESVQQSRRLIRQPHQAQLNEVIKTEGEVFKKLLATKQCQQRLAQFFAKR